MKSQTAINLCLLALVLLLAGIVQLHPGDSESLAPPPPLTPLSVEQIHRIRIIDRRQGEILLERHQGQWRMIAPFMGAAKAERIQPLLELVTAPSHASFPLPATPLGEFGLDPSRIRVWLNDTELHFGGNDPLNLRRYVRIGDQIHLITDRFYHLLLASPEDFLAEPEAETPN